MEEKINFDELVAKEIEEYLLNKNNVPFDHWNFQAREYLESSSINLSKFLEELGYEIKSDTIFRNRHIRIEQSLLQISYGWRWMNSEFSFPLDLNNEEIRSQIIMVLEHNKPTNKWTNEDELDLSEWQYQDKYYKILLSSGFREYCKKNDFPLYDDDSYSLANAFSSWCNKHLSEEVYPRIDPFENLEYFKYCLKAFKSRKSFKFYSSRYKFSTNNLLNYV